MKKTRNSAVITAFLFVAFILFTVFVKTVNVAAIGPQNSSVGFSSLNGFVFAKLGESSLWYEISEVFGLVALAVAGSFALFGVYQLITRKSLKKVDFQLYALAGFYVLVGIAYVLFEVLVINYRPVLSAEGALEASYPSSHTILATCIMSSAIVMFNYLFKNKKTLKGAAVTISAVIIAVTVVARLLSGVHWLTDILGGLFLSAALVSLFVTVVSFFDEKKRAA